MLFSIVMNASTDSLSPLFSADGTSLAPNVTRILRDRFGFETLRPGQAEALAPVLEHRDTLVVMPTGAGKSLIYQLAACLQKGVTVVVSPLIALMKDQVDALQARGIEAAYVNSSQTQAEQLEVLNALDQGLLRLVYVAPERLRLRSFQRALRRTTVSLLAVDEAHCVSQWGHDFRPDYLTIATARRRIQESGVPPCVALTATATPRVQDDIATSLELRDPARLVTGFNRPNLYFDVRSTPNADEKRAALGQFLAARPGAPGLIYVSTRRAAEQLAEWIPEHAGRACKAYHAGLSDGRRAQVQEDFLTGRLDLVVATNAFGMGVDRADVRFVAHWAVPSNLESYYQEAGRAGRDGEPATCVLFYAPHDRSLREWFLDQQSPEIGDLKAVHRELLRQAGTEGVASGTPDDFAEAADRHPVGGGVALTLLDRAGLIERLGDQGAMRSYRVLPWNEAAAARLVTRSTQRKDRRASDLQTVIDYAESDDCRRTALLTHFGDDPAPEVEPCCDLCSMRDELGAIPDELPPYDSLPMETRVALGLLDCVRRLRWAVGRRTLAKIFTGSSADGMWRYENEPYYGKLSSRTQDEVDALYKHLIREGYLRVGGEYPVVELTARGTHALDRRAVIEMPEGARVARSSGSSSSSGGEEPLTGEAAALFETLRAWRTKEASEQGVPAYVVGPDAVLRALAEARPETEQALLSVSGIGPSRAERYGEAILRILREDE